MASSVLHRTSFSLRCSLADSLNSETNFVPASHPTKLRFVSLMASHVTSRAATVPPTVVVCYVSQISFSRKLLSFPF
jgi:hypothetical protein